MKLKILALVGLFISGIFVLNTSSNAQIINEYPQLPSSASVCGGGTQNPEINSLTDNQPIDDDIEVNVTNVPGNTKNVLFWLNDKVLGQGHRDGDNPENWNMIWKPSFTQPGPRVVIAEIVFDGGSCITPPKNVNVNSTTLIPVFAPPINEDTLTNYQEVLEVDLDVSGADSGLIEEYGFVHWRIEPSSFGTINKIPENNAKFWSSTPGSVRAIASIFYGGNEPIEQEFFINVFSPNSGGGSTTDPDPEFEDDEFEDSTTSTPGTGDTPSPESDDELRVVENPREFIEHVLSDEEIQGCFERTIGDDAINKMKEENRRPKYDEFEKIYECFEEQNHVIPSIMAPVDPAVVVELKESRLVKLEKIENGEIQDENGETKQVIVLSGATEPNKKVLLYVFSEPLVLATTSDSDGTWTYTLEDPMAPGNHEVYALVDRGDGEYERSSVASFVIGTAEATDDNPSGLSLNLISEPTITANNDSVNLFIAASIGIVTFMAVILIGVVLRRSQHQNTPTTENGDVISSNVPSDDEVKNIYKNL